MQNLFMPSETVACIEQKYVGKTYKVKGKAFTEPFTKEKIRLLFGLYVDSINQVFGGRAIVMQRTRAIKAGTVVPVTSFEYVYGNKQSISTYVEEGYYALTINGYRIRDIIDSAYHYFTDNLTNGGKIIESLSMILDISKEDVKGVLVKFFCNNGFETFDAFLQKIMETGKMDVYTFDVCASLTGSFSEPVPSIGTATEIQVMSRHAQDEGLAVDECDLDGWKGKTPNGRNERNVCSFFDQALENHERFCGPVPADEEPKKDCICDSCKHQGEDVCAKSWCEEAEKEKDNLAEIRKDIDDENTKDRSINEDLAKHKEEEPVRENDCKDEHVDISTASDGNNYTYSITWTDKDGKPQSKTFYGEAAKKMMSKGDCMDEKLKDKCDNSPTLKDAFNFFDKRLAKLEGDMRNLQRPERPVRVRLDRDPFDLFGGFRDLFGGF